jgi:hypothetical protein
MLVVGIDGSRISRDDRPHRLDVAALAGVVNGWSLHLTTRRSFYRD